MTIQIVVGRDILLGCPGQPGKGFPFMPGQKVFIGWVPTEHGDGKPIETKDELSFWTGADIDFGLIFKPVDIATIRISETDKRLEFLRRVWPDAPLEVLPEGFWNA